MKTETESFHRDHSRVIVFPPVIPVAGFLFGVLLQRLVPLGPWPPGWLRTGVRELGGMIFGVGIGGFAWMVVTMKRARTPIDNSRTPTTLVETGPFRLTRNPMYLFGSIAYAGLGLLLLQAWSLLLLVPVLLTTHYGVVLREENYLGLRFGDDYRRYKERVPRYW